MTATRRADYGVDGYRYLVGLAATSITSLGLALAARAVPWVSLVAGALGILAAVPTLLGVQYVAWGKFRHRDRLLALVDWRGDERVLDVGTGGGLMAIGAARRVPRGSVIGVDVWVAKDLSGNAAERARHNVRLEGVAERVEIRDGDARALPFTAGSIDVIVSTLCVHNIDDSEGRQAALSEMTRVLSAGGTLVLSDLDHVPAYADWLRGLGMRVQIHGPFWDTFPPQRVIVAKRAEST